MSHQIFKSFVSLGSYFVNFKRNIHIVRTLYGTHYDTLKLPRDCTSKEVRESFIKLSKQCHPDRNRSDPNTHAKFVKLNEAYSVLSRPDKRQAYDLTLKPLSSESYHRSTGRPPFDIYTTAYRQRVVWRDESFWEYKDKNTHESGDYYGIRGVKRVPNGWIAILCFVFAAAGVWLQILLIKHSTAFNRNALDERSQVTSKMLSDVQERAQRHGNKAQLELLKQRLKSPNETLEDEIKSTPENKAEIDYYSKVNLGYLGEMPHTIRNDVQLELKDKSLMPELHNIPLNKNIENDILPKPILYNTPNVGNEEKPSAGPPLLWNL